MAGYALLRSWLRLRGLSQRALARVLGVGESTLWAWGQGRSRPSLDVAAAIERVSGGAVPAASWATPGVCDRAFARMKKIDNGSADSGGRDSATGV